MRFPICLYSKETLSLWLETYRHTKVSPHDSMATLPQWSYSLVVATFGFRQEKSYFLAKHFYHGFFDFWL